MRYQIGDTVRFWWKRTFIEDVVEEAWWSGNVAMYRLREFGIISDVEIKDSGQPKEEEYVSD